MNSKVLNRKMFDRTFRDARGVGITSGLDGRSRYARGGRIGFQDGTIKEEFDEKFGGINYIDPNYQSAAEELYPQIDSEEYLKGLQQQRDQYAPGLTAGDFGADMRDLSQFFFNLPGQGTLGENIARSASEVLPQFSKRRQEEALIDKQLAMADIQALQEAEATRKDNVANFIKDRIAAKEAEDLMMAKQAATAEGMAGSEFATLLKRSKPFQGMTIDALGLDPNNLPANFDALVEKDALAYGALLDSGDITATQGALFLQKMGLLGGKSWSELLDDKLVEQAQMNPVDPDNPQKNLRQLEAFNSIYAQAKEMATGIKGYTLYSQEDLDDMVSGYNLYMDDYKEGKDSYFLESRPLVGEGKQMFYESIFQKLEDVPSSPLDKDYDEGIKQILAWVDEAWVYKNLTPGMTVVLPNGAEVVYKGRREANNPDNPLSAEELEMVKLYDETGDEQYNILGRLRWDDTPWQMKFGQE